MQDAEEAADDAMMAVFNNWGEIENPIAFLYTVAQRRGSDAARKALAREKSEAKAMRDSQLLAETPEEIGLTQDILNALKSLPPRQREVIAMRMDGYTMPEMAEWLGITEAGVRSTLRKARTALKVGMPDVSSY